MIRLYLYLILSYGLLLQATAQSSLDKQGHRGCRGLMPENTIPAMKLALDIGVNTLEMDIIISKDQLAVVSHDPYISADISLTPEGHAITASDEKSYVLYHMPYSEIRKFDVGSKPNPKFPDQKKMKAYKPLLSELIDSVENYVKEKNLPAPYYNIEIKSSPEGDNKLHPEPAIFTDLVMKVLLKEGITDRVIIQSFDARPLQLLHREYPDLKLAYLTANIKSIKSNLDELGFTPYAYSPYYKTLKRKTIDTCHGRQIRVIPWTVDTKDEISKMIKLGVDGIITDYPNLFLTN